MTLTLAAVLALAPVRPDAIKIDAFFDDWTGRASLPVRTAVSGRPDADQARVQLAWTPEHLLLAVQVVDDRYQPGDGQAGDRLTLTWAGHALEIVLRDLESPPPLARVDGRDVPGAKFHGTLRKDGWALEAAIPLRALPTLAGDPVNLAVVIHDADETRAADSVRASAPLDAQLQALETTVHFGATAGLLERFEAEQSHAPPLRTLTGNLYGSDALQEELRISSQEIVVLGHELPDGMGYTFATHGWRSDPTLTEVILAELDGRPGLELFVAHRAWAVPGETQVEVAEIWSVTAQGLRCLFAQKVGEFAPGFGGEATTSVQVMPGDPPVQLKVAPARVKGFNAGNYVSVDPPSMPFHPLPMPWEQTKPRVFRLVDGTWQ